MKSKTYSDLRVLFFALTIMWLFVLLGPVLGQQIELLSLIPRQLTRIHAIFTMHFVHWSLPHLIANSIPMAILGSIVFLTGKGKQISLFIMILSGLLVWCFARPYQHAGASGLILGYMGFLLSQAFFKHSIKNILISILSIVLYGGIMVSLIDFRESTSYEGHLFGFLSGIVGARFFAKHV